MKQYVLGFLFSDTGDSVVLIRKKRPQWQAGLLNGVGGKIEPGENPRNAMIREFREETGITVDSWDLVGILHGPDASQKENQYVMHVFKAFASIGLANTKTVTDEEIEVWGTNEIKQADTSIIIHNLSWLIPMCLDGNVKEITVLAE